MKYIILSILFLFAFNLNAQLGKRVKFKTGVERCLDVMGDPIENCFIMSNAQGEFIPTTIEDVVAEMNISNNSAVDSIYTSGDTLYVVYFDAPTLAYKANGLNGLYSLSNNNKVMSVYQTTLGTNGWTIQKAGGTYGMTFNNSINATVFNGSIEPVRTNNQMGFTGGGRTWRAGASGPTYAITDATTGGTPTRFSIAHGSLITSLTLRSDGDVQFGNYTSSRPYDFFDGTNFAFFNSVGVLKKGNIENLVDVVADSVLIMDQATTRHQLYVLDEAYTTDGTDAGFEQYATSSIGTNALIDEDDGVSIIGQRRSTVSTSGTISGVKLARPLYLGGGVYEYEIGITNIAQLSSAANDYQLIIGLLPPNQAQTHQAEFVGFIYDSIGISALGSAQWVISTTNDAFREIDDTNVLVEIGTPYHLRFVVNENVSQVDFYINHVNVGTHTLAGAMPDDGYADKFVLGYYIKKIAGAGAVSFDVDYQSAKYTYTTPKFN